MTDDQTAQAFDLSLGYGPIDAMHEEFLQHCGALASAKREDCLEKLDALLAHCMEHFGSENQWMRETGYGAAGCHVAEHESVLEVLRQVRERFFAGDIEPVSSLARELPQWFAQHVLGMDRQLAMFLGERIPG